MGAGVGRWSEVHGPRPHCEIFLFPYFKTYFTQICCLVIFRQQIKTFHSNNVLFPKCMSLKRKAIYTVQSKSNARAKSGIRSCCATRTCKPPQEAKVQYFADPLWFTFLASCWTQAQCPAKSHTKLPACGSKKKFLHVHYFWAVYTDE